MSQSSVNVPSLAECERLLTVPGSPFELAKGEINGRITTYWKNTPQNFQVFLKAKCKEWRDIEAISSPLPPPAAEDERERVTYGQLYERAVVQGAWLRSLGVKRGDKVALGGGNKTGWVVAWFAILLIGAIPALLNTTLQNEGTVHCLAITEPVIVLVDQEMAGKVARLAEKLKGKKIGPIYAYESIKHHNPIVRRVITPIGSPKVDPKLISEVDNGVGLETLGHLDDGMIFFTSGTSGLPKAVLSNQLAGLHPIISGAYTSARAVMRATGASLEEIITAPPAAQLVALISVPLFHVTGSLAHTLRSIAIGGKVVFQRRWSVPEAVKVIIADKVNFIGGVPAIPASLLNSPLMPDGHEILAASYGGAPSARRLAGDISRKWPTAVVSHAWGMTETNSMHTSISGLDFVNHPDCTGPPVPICEVRVVDPETRKDLPVGTMGLLLARGSNVMTCYFNNPKATAEVFDKDGWLDTGDMGSLDSENMLYILDRKKDMIIRGGENIPSAEVENALAQDDRIDEIAAVPVPDDILGERVGAMVSLKLGTSATEESIIAAVESRLRYPSRPVIVVVSKVALPRNANGKIIKTDCRKIVVQEWEARGRKGNMDTTKARL